MLTVKKKSVIRKKEINQVRQYSTIIYTKKGKISIHALQAT